MNRKIAILITLCITALKATAISLPQVSIVADAAHGVVFEHGLIKLKEALNASGFTFEQVSSLNAAKGKNLIIINNKTLNGVDQSPTPYYPEALNVKKTILRKKPAIIVNGSDDNGVMYALLDVANRLSWKTKTRNFFENVKDISEQPAIAERAVSVYTMNRSYWESRFYDEKYWVKYFDMLAADRFNMFTIIFGYENGGFLAPPYPYFFNVAGYPGVKMNGLTQEQQQRNLAALKRIIQLAHERGIGITLGIWDHIYRGGIQAGNFANEADEEKSKFGLVTGLDGDNLIAYTKAAFSQLINDVPGIDAIQFRMHDESGLKKGEQRPFWRDLFQTIKDKHPNLRLVLRAKGLPDETIDDAISAGVNFTVNTKFWMEQTGLPYSPTHVYKQDQKTRRHGYADMLQYPTKFKMAWQLWTGGTNRILTWGDPDYASRFIRSLDIYGSNSYAFDVNEMLATKMESQPHDEKPFEVLTPAYQYYDYEFERYWAFYLSYGRMGYNPNTSRTVWDNEYKKRFGDKAGPIVESAVQIASKVLPRIVASAYNYSFFPTTRGWAEKQRIGDLNEYAKSQGSDVQQFANFEEEAQLLLTKGTTAKILPSMNSLWFRQTSDAINTLIADANNSMGTKANKEFNATITDLKILSNLSLYHARRIPAAVYYRLYVNTKDPAALDSAIKNEHNAIAAWRAIVDAAGDMYAADLKFGLAHTSFEGIKFEQSGHWKDELALLETDLAKLQQELEKIKNNQPAKPSPVYKTAEKSSNASYFTITHQPVLKARAGKPVTIKVKATAKSGLKSVTLQYRAVNQYLDFTALPMLPTAEKDTYQAIIPADKIDPKWDLMYLIEVTDKNGHGFIYPDLNYTVPYIVTKLMRP